MVKKYLISFASPDLNRSSKRYIDQAQNLKFYDEISVFSLFDLDKNNQSKILSLLKEKKKTGYGYWYWKPLIINQTLKKANDGDIIHYTDIGCHLNPRGIERLNYYINSVENSEKGILAFQYKPLENYQDKNFEFPDIIEAKYTKSDLFDYFNVLDKKQITHSSQYWAGNIFFKKNMFTLNFLSQWIDIFEKRFDLVDDTPSKLANFENFFSNKHDQSVFSILCKINNIKSLSAYECEWFYLNGARYWLHTEKSPVIAKRDKKYSLIRRFFNRQIRTIRRYHSKFFKS
tara:strand:+ start:121 stop:984 length:864 start_codon:yes stop_codon:yes gene_type:complete